MSKTKSTDPAPEPGSAARIDEAYQLLKDAAPIRIKVGGQWSTVTPHPASLLFPVVSREEFGALVADVAEHGFKQFPHLRSPGSPTDFYGKDMEVVEGRHRCAVAYALDKILSVNKFTGTDAEARIMVISSNLHRRHLTKAQEALIVCQEFLPIAQGHATVRRKKGNARGGKGKSTASRRLTSVPTESSASAAEEASQMSGGLVSARSIERMQIVTEAETPDTYARVWDGSIVSVVAAHNAAVAEMEERAQAARLLEEEGASAAEKPARAPRSSSVGTSLDKAYEALHKDVEELRKGLRPILGAEEQRERLIEIGSLVDEWFRILDHDDDPTRTEPPRDEAF